MGGLETSGHRHGVGVGPEILRHGASAEQDMGSPSFDDLE